MAAVLVITVVTALGGWLSEARSGAQVPGTSQSRTNMEGRVHLPLDFPTTDTFIVLTSLLFRIIITDQPRF